MTDDHRHQVQLSILHGMVGGGNRRWTAALLSAYTPIKDPGRLTEFLEELVALGLVGKAAAGLYVLNDAGRLEFGREYGF